MNIERRILNRDEIPEEFFQSTNVWHEYAQAIFHNSLGKKDIEVEAKPHTAEARKWIRSQLGVYNWDLVNMHLSQDHKIAWCAYLFSKVYTIVNKPDNLHEGPYVRPPAPTKEEWLAQIHASTERELKEEKERKEKIESGEIVLPDPTRPYEIWLKDETGKEYRYKTARSREALARSIEFAGLHSGSYRESFCFTDHEDSRKFFE